MTVRRIVPIALLVGVLPACSGGGAPLTIDVQTRVEGNTATVTVHGSDPEFVANGQDVGHRLQPQRCRGQDCVMTFDLVGYDGAMPVQIEVTAQPIEGDGDAAKTFTLEWAPPPVERSLEFSHGVLSAKGMDAHSELTFDDTGARLTITGPGEIAMDAMGFSGRGTGTAILLIPTSALFQSAPKGVLVRDTTDPELVAGPIDITIDGVATTGELELTDAFKDWLLARIGTDPTRGFAFPDETRGSGKAAIFGVGGGFAPHGWPLVGEPERWADITRVGQVSNVAYGDASCGTYKNSVTGQNVEVKVKVQSVALTLFDRETGKTVGSKTFEAKAKCSDQLAGTETFDVDPDAPTSWIRSNL